MSSPEYKTKKVELHKTNMKTKRITGREGWFFFFIVFKSRWQRKGMLELENHLAAVIVKDQCRQEASVVQINLRDNLRSRHLQSEKCLYIYLSLRGKYIGKLHIVHGDDEICHHL